MAYVPNSSHALRDIRRYINTMRCKEFKSYNFKPLFANNLIVPADYVEKTAWGNDAHLRSQLPNHWLRNMMTMNVTLQWKDENGLRHHVNYLNGDFDLEPMTYRNIPLDRTAVLPPRHCFEDSYNQYKIDVEVFGISMERQMEYRATLNAANELNAKWDNIRKQVINFFERMKSINEGVRLMPVFELFLPQEMRSAIAERTGKGRYAPIDPNKVALLNSMDIDELTAIAVEAKLLEV